MIGEVDVGDSQQGSGQLPDRQWLTLSEALSWMHCRVSMDRGTLARAISADFKAGERELDVTMIKLADLAAGDKIGLRGKWTSAPGDYTGKETENIPSEKLHDYRAFNVVHDGLQYGTIAGNDMPAFLDHPPGLFFDVQVNRDDLVRQQREIDERLLAALMARDWEALLAVVWIATRDLDQVAIVADLLDNAPGSDESDCGLLATGQYLAGRATKAAENELLQAAKVGTIEIMGLENGGGNYRAIPTDSFIDAGVSYEKHGLQLGPTDFLRPGASRWTNLRLKPQKVMERWEPISVLSDDVDPEPMQTGDPGRPPKGRQFYVAEHERRCQSGEALRSVAAEARHLEKWFREEHPDADRCKALSIENTIRSRHRSYRSRVVPQNLP